MIPVDDAIRDALYQLCDLESRSFPAASPYDERAAILRDLVETVQRSQSEIERRDERRKAQEQVVRMAAELKAHMHGCKCHGLDYERHCAKLSGYQDVLAEVFGMSWPDAQLAGEPGSMPSVVVEGEPLPEAPRTEEATEPARCRVMVDAAPGSHGRWRVAAWCNRALPCSLHAGEKGEANG